jgi:hypothetical protein
MSRIGKKEIILPAGVTVSVDPAAVTVKGPKGELQTPVHPKVVYAVEGATVTVNRVDDPRIARAQHGLRRTLLSNCVYTRPTVSPLGTRGPPNFCKRPGKYRCLSMPFRLPRQVANMAKAVPKTAAVGIIGSRRESISLAVNSPNWNTLSR